MAEIDGRWPMLHSNAMIADDGRSTIEKRKSAIGHQPSAIEQQSTVNNFKIKTACPTT
ncbi:MAG: hypothetical protein ABW007_02940 [Chitinophagaceae bacterium]